MSDQVESMFSVKLTPWHGKGAVLQEHPTSAQAIKAAGLDWPVEQRHVYWGKPQGDVIMPIQVPNRKALVRVKYPDPALCDDTQIGVPEEDLLSIVSDAYKPLQNTEAFAFFDPLVQSGDLVYETAGSLFGGRKIWVLARYLRKQIKIMGNDEVRPYVLLVNGHDGVTGIMVQPTPVRVVCNNTLMASQSCGMQINFKHVGDVAAEIEKAKEVLESMRTSFDEMELVWSNMAETHVTPTEVDWLIHSVCCPKEWQNQVTDQPDENEIETQGEITPRKITRVQAMEKRILELMIVGQGASAETKGTVWGVYNAMIEFADYYMGARSKDRANYELFGDGARFKETALAVCKDYMQNPMRLDAPF